MSGRIIAFIIGFVLLVAAVGIGFVIIGKRNPAPTTSPGPTTPAPSQSPTPTPSTTPTPSPSPSSALDPNSVIAADPITAGQDATKRYNAVISKLTSWPLWKQNALFSGLFIAFGPTLEYNSGNEVYVFDSPDDKANHFTISVAQGSGNMLRALIPKDDYQPDVTPINRDFWKINYVEALQFAETEGGTAYRSQNKVTSVDVNLLRTTPNNFLYYVVTYHTKNPTQLLTIKIDAKDKTLVKE